MQWKYTILCYDLIKKFILFLRDYRKLKAIHEQENNLNAKLNLYGIDGRNQRDFFFACDVFSFIGLFLNDCPSAY